MIVSLQTLVSAIGDYVSDELNESNEFFEKVRMRTRSSPESGKYYIFHKDDLDVLELSSESQENIILEIKKNLNQFEEDSFEDIVILRR